MESEGWIARLKRKKRRTSSTNKPNNGINNRLRRRRDAFAGVHFVSDKRKKALLLLVENDDVTKMTGELSEGVDLAEADEASELLRRSCEKGLLDMATVLLRYGAPVDVPNEDLSPLHITVKRGHVSIMALLLTHGADINICTKFENRSALHLAAILGQDDIVRMLLQNEARVNLGDIYGTRPLHLAARLGHKTTVRLLLEYGALIDAYDKEGWTALHLAAETGHLDVTDMLLEHHADANCRTKYARTPLHWAVLSERVSVVRRLLEAEANPHILDLHEKAPVEYCADPAIRRLLEFYSFRGDDQVDTAGLSVGDMMPNLREYERKLSATSRTSSDDGTLAVSSQLRSTSLASAISSLSNEGLAAGDVRVGRSQFFQVMRDAHQQIDAFENSVAELATEVGKLPDGGAKKLSPDALRGVRHKVHQTQDMIQDFKHEFHSELSRLWTLFDERLTRLDSKLSGSGALPPVIYCRFVAVASRHIARISNAWKRILSELARIASHENVHLEDVSDSVSDETGRAYETMLSVTRAAHDANAPVIKYAVELMERCNVEGLNTRSVLTDFVFFDKQAKSKEVTVNVQILNSLAQSLGTDGQKVAAAYGFSASRLSQLEDDLQHSSYHINIRVLAQWESAATGTTGREKVLSLVETLIGIGREDTLLNVLEHCAGGAKRKKKQKNANGGGESSSSTFASRHDVGSTSGSRHDADSTLSEARSGDVTPCESKSGPKSPLGTGGWLTAGIGSKSTSRSGSPSYVRSSRSASPSSLDVSFALSHESQA